MHNQGKRRVVSTELTKVALAISTVVLSSIVSATAHAQDQNQEPEAEAGVLERIMVTARKRTESLQEIPVAATAFGEAELAMRGVADVQDLGFSVPNLAYSDRQGSLSSIGIRGISSNARNVGIEDSVGVYIDGVFIGRSAFYNLELADVEQVEVLRGPQGTLFGKNTIAGALNISTKSVNEELEATFKGSLGNYGYTNFKGSVSGGSDSIRGRVSLMKKDSDGFMKNELTNKDLQALDEFGIATKIEIDATDALELVLNADYTKKDNDINASQMIVASGGFGLDAAFANTGPFNISEDGPQKDNQEVKGLSLTATYDTNSDYQITAIAAWRDMELDVAFDDDNTPVTFSDSYFTDAAEQSSLEFRLMSPNNDDFEWLIGAFYFDQRVDSTRRTPVVGGTLGTIAGEGGIEVQSLAAYFSGDWHISTSFDVNFGLRWTQDEKNASWLQTGVAPVGVPDVTQNASKSFSELSPTLAVSWHLEYATVYAKYSEGFKSGGFMADIIGEAPDAFVLDSETVHSYELGLKSTLFDGSMRLNAALFSMDYDNLQVISLVGATFEGDNAGTATIRGAEIEIQWYATEDLLFKGGLGLTNSKYDQFLTATGNDYSGNTLRNAPDMTTNLTAEYRVPLKSGELVALAEASYRDEVWYDPSNSEAVYQGDVSLFNARIGYSSQEANWSVFLYGKNLSNEEYTAYRRNGPFGQSSGTYGEPRTVGVEFTYNYW